MGTYCENHLREAIDKYLDFSKDDMVMVTPTVGEHLCSNTDCDNEGIYTVGYNPKTQEQLEKEIICKCCNTLPCMCGGGKR